MVVHHDGRAFGDVQKFCMKAPYMKHVWAELRTSHLGDNLFDLRPGPQIISQNRHSTLDPSTNLLITESTPSQGSFQRKDQRPGEAGRRAEIPEKADYAVSKYKAELEVWRGGEEGLEVCMVRPTIILGEGDFSKSSGKLFLQVDKGLPVYPVGANGFVASKDVASACLAIAEAGLWGKAFVLNGANMKFKDAFEKIAASIGAKAPARPLKRWMSNLVCALPFVQNKIGLKAMQEDTVYDGSKVVEAIDGWSYSDIDEVIKEVGKVYLAG